MLIYLLAGTAIIAGFGLSYWLKRDAHAGVAAVAVPNSLVDEMAPADENQHFSDGNGFPLLAWAAVEAVRSDETALARLQRAWLLHLRDACGEGYRLHESEHAYVVSALPDSVVNAAMAYVGKTRTRVSKVLDGIAQFHANEKSTLLVLPDEDTYYQYVANFYPDGEFAFSSGMFLNAGCPHFVVVAAELAVVEPIIAHEMTHSALSYLSLPRWLDEGLAVNTENRLCTAPPPRFTAQELHRKHLAYWGVAELQAFWSGESFSRTDDGNMLSYDLARILVEHLSQDWPRFRQFVLHAQYIDSGAAAAASALDVRLGMLVCGMLGHEHLDAYEPDAAQWEPADALASRTRLDA